MTLDPFVAVPEYVRAVDVGPATVIVNYRDGRTHVLIGEPARWWQAATTSGRADPPGLLDTRTAETLRGQLLAAGLITPTQTHRQGRGVTAGPAWAPSWGTQEMPAGRADAVPVPLGATVRASVALVVVFGVLAAGRGDRRMARLLRLLTWANHHTTINASDDHGREAVHAVRRAARFMPGRVACLEESAAAVLVLAFERESATWCHGAAADPVRLHAWVETGTGYRVAEPSSTARFAVLRTIPERGDESENQRA